MSTLAGGEFGPGDIKYQLDHWDDNESPVIIAVTTVLFVGALVSVVLRLLARKVKHLRLDWDDYWIILSLVSQSLQNLGQ